MKSSRMSSERWNSQQAFTAKTLMELLNSNRQFVVAVKRQDLCKKNWYLVTFLQNDTAFNDVYVSFMEPKGSIYSLFKWPKPL